MCVKFLITLNWNYSECFNKYDKKSCNIFVNIVNSKVRNVGKLTSNLIKFTANLPVLLTFYSLKYTQFTSPFVKQFCKKLCSYLVILIRFMIPKNKNPKYSKKLLCVTKLLHKINKLVRSNISTVFPLLTNYANNFRTW